MLDFVIKHHLILYPILPFFGALISAITFSITISRNIAILLAIINFIISLVPYNNLSSEYNLGGWSNYTGINLHIWNQSWLLISVINFIFLFILIFGYKLLESFVNDKYESSKKHLVYTLLQLAQSGFVGILVTQDFFTLYVFIEISSLSSYVLLTMSNKRSLVNALDYLILGTIGATFILVAIGIILKTTGHLNMIEAQKHIIVNKAFSIAIIMYIVGILLKLAFFPIHGWMVYAYKNVFSVILAYIGSISSLVATYILYELIYLFLKNTHNYSLFSLKEFLYYFSGFVMIFFAYCAYIENNLRKILLFSSSIYAGYFIMMVVSGISSEILTYYLTVISIIKLGLFYVISILEKNNIDMDVRSIIGIGSSSKIFCIFYTILVISNAGLPISAGFIGKILLLKNLSELKYYYGIVTILISSSIALLYNYKILIPIFQPTQSSSINIKLDFSEKTGLLIITTLQMLLIILPNYLSEPDTKSLVREESNFVANVGQVPKGGYHGSLLKAPELAPPSSCNLHPRHPELVSGSQEPLREVCKTCRNDWMMSHDDRVVIYNDSSFKVNTSQERHHEGSYHGSLLKAPEILKQVPDDEVGVGVKGNRVWDRNGIQDNLVATQSNTKLIPYLDSGFLYGIILISIILLGSCAVNSCLRLFLLLPASITYMGMITYIAYNYFKYHMGEIYQLFNYKIHNFEFLSFSADFYSIIYLLLLSILWPISILYTDFYLKGLYKMQGDNIQRGTSRFMFFINLCIISASFIAISGNLITMFSFYEILSLSTIPLIIYSATKESYEALYKYLQLLFIPSTLFFLLAIFLIYSYGNGGLFIDSNGILENTDITDLGAVLLLLLFILGISKVATLPFCSWLPTSMVALHPVSAILHAVAVVNSGIFCLAKIILYIFGVEFMAPIYNSQYLLLIPVITVIFASIMALYQNSLKKILAYSTIAQMNIMLGGLLSFTKIGVISVFMHMIVHSLTKLLLFFKAGDIYIATKATKLQDLLGLARKMPLTYIMLIIATLSLAGFPILPSHFTKTQIVNSFSDIRIPATYLMKIISLFTCVYLSRILYAMSGISKSNNKISPVSQMQLLPSYIILALIIIISGLIFIYSDSGIYNSIGEIMIFMCIFVLIKIIFDLNVTKKNLNIGTINTKLIQLSNFISNSIIPYFNEKALALASPKTLNASLYSALGLFIILSINLLI